MLNLRMHPDVDECQPEVKVCSQLCNNTDGGFQGYCEPGYDLASNERTCLGELSCHNSILNGILMHLIFY